jgi:predicted Ser/Thr protein kinase
MGDRSPIDDRSDTIEHIASGVLGRFEADRRILSFAQYLERLEQAPTLFARNTAQYTLDAIDYFGVEEVVRGGEHIRRHLLFDCPFDEGHERVVGNEATQAGLVQALNHFVRERRVNRLILIHGPNGSAKSSLIACLTRALEAYSNTDEGALYRFHWVFPSGATEGGRIGFGGAPPVASGAQADTYAFVDERFVDTTLPSEHNDNPIYLIPPGERSELLTRLLEPHRDFVLSDTVLRGDLGHRSRAVYDALLAAYRGEYQDVVRHVRVERFYISRRYRRAAVTVEPQLHVDAGSRQLTIDRSLSALPRVLQSQSLFEAFGPLVEGNRGVVEYNDLLKRPLDANKYLLATSEKGTVSLDTGEIHLDALLIATANEKYLEAFKQQPDWPSYKGRIALVRMPYLLDYRAEQQIYDAQLASLQLDKPVAPHTTFVAALWAVLTRLVRPEPDAVPPELRAIVSALAPVQKAHLYADGPLPPGLGAEQAAALRGAVAALASSAARYVDYEGRHGASPREIKAAILDAAHQPSPTLSPSHVLDALERLLEDASVYEWLRMPEDQGYRAYGDFVDAVRAVYLDRVERELRSATGLVDPAEYRRLFKRYVEHVNHAVRGERLVDPITGRPGDPDESFMDEVEQTLGREEPAAAFRSHLINRVAAWRIDNPSAEMDLEHIFPDLFERMRAAYHASKRRDLQRIQQDLIAMLDGEDPDDDEARARARATLGALETRHGYTRETAREAVGLLLAERYGGATAENTGD